MGIVVIGAVFVDIKGYPNAQFIPNGRNAGRVNQVHGGVCRNVVEDIANIELRPTFVSVVDHSGISQDVIDKLNRHKVNTKYIAKTDDGLGTWLAIFDNEGDVVASISKRPELDAIKDILDEHGDEIISTCDSVVLEIDMETPIVKKVFDLAEKYNKKVYAIVSNMSIAVERRDLIKRTDCFVCNSQEAEIFFSDFLEDKTPDELAEYLFQKVKVAQINSMVITMGEKGAVYADSHSYGVVPAPKVNVIDTTGCGDSFFSGVVIGLTYGKTLEESCKIGTRLASSVIATKENVCPRFLPEEFHIEVKIDE